VTHGEISELVDNAGGPWGSSYTMSRAFILVVLVVVVLAFGTWLALTLEVRGLDEEIGEVVVAPEGHWHPFRASEVISEREDELARLLSLGYVEGRIEAGERFGVTVHDESRSWPGLNLYVSGHGPEAILIDMSGEVLHRWRLPFDEAFREVPEGSNPTYWRRVHLLPDGSLLAIFQAGGMVKVDAGSRLVWSLDEGFYNDIEVSGDGMILAIGKAARIFPEINPQEPVLEEFIVRISPGGEVVDRLSILKAFDVSVYRNLLQPMADRGDILHTNTVEWLDGSSASFSTLFERGNLLVSLREVDIVAILDPARGVVEWAARGPWDAQHQPSLLANGRILLFDNRGADGFSRVAEVEVDSGEIVWAYPREGESARLSSPEAGSVQRLPGGTTLVTESEHGRAVEVTRDGEVVWEFLSPHRAGPSGNLVATLFEVVRLPFEAAEFLESGQSE
jgi:hypothetical protein